MKSRPLQSAFREELFPVIAQIAAVLFSVVIGAQNATPTQVQSQTTPRLQFDVASVKRNNSGSRAVRFGGGPNRLSAENVTLRMLMSLAYNLEDFRILEMPGWVESDRFDVEAKADGNPTRQQMTSMLQTLLEDRFKLSLHHDTKELPVYLLSVAQNGPKLKAGDCITRDPNTPPTPGQRQSAFCGFLSSGSGHIQATSMRMETLAELLTNTLKRKVIDKTGFEGHFDVSLNFAPVSPANGDTASPATDNSGPSIFTALQEQLGLKLESEKGPVEVVVINRVERPSEN